MSADPELDRLRLHADAQVAAIVWAKLLPTSFAGSIPCSFLRSVGVSKLVMRDSLALVTNARPPALFQ